MFSFDYLLMSKELRHGHALVTYLVDARQYVDEQAGPDRAVKSRKSVTCATTNYPSHLSLFAESESLRVFQHLLIHRPAQGDLAQDVVVSLDLHGGPSLAVLQGRRWMRSVPQEKRWFSLMAHDVRGRYRYARRWMVVGG